MSNSPAKRIILAFLLLSVVACGAQTRMPQPRSADVTREAAIQRQIALEDYAEVDSRLYRIGLPIMVANSEFCGQFVETTYGFMAHSAADYKGEFRAAAERAFGFRGLPRVYALAPVVASAGLRVGDEVMSANGVSAGDIKQLRNVLRPQTSFPLELVINRNGATKRFSLPPMRRCSFNFALQVDDTVNAWTDGEDIYFTTGIMRYLSEDIRVAGVFGHELAHITMSHVDKKKTQATVGAVLGAIISATIGVDVTNAAAQVGGAAYSQEYEAEADYVGAYFTARAGWNVDDLPNIWRRMAAGNPGFIHFQDGTHPSSAFRFSALEKTVAEIKQKRLNGEELRPNFAD